MPKRANCYNEAGIQVLRTILVGRFEQFPELQLIAGHWGEMVPFFLSRLDQSIPPMVGLPESLFCKGI